MAYEPTIWKDRVVEKPRTFNIVNNPDGTVTLVPAPGVVVEEGTPVNAANLNKLEQGLKTHEAESATDAHLPKNVGLGNVQNYGIATQAEAEEGNVNNKYMTPLRVKEIIQARAVSRQVQPGNFVLVEARATSASNNWLGGGTTTGAWEPRVRQVIGVAGGIRVVFDTKADSDDNYNLQGTWQFAVGKNGSRIKTFTQTISSKTPITMEYDLLGVSPGDVIEIWTKGNTDNKGRVGIGAFKIGVSTPPIAPIRYERGVTGYITL